MGSACTHHVYVDGEAVGQLNTGERMELHVHPGDKMLGLVVPKVCGGSVLEAAVTLRAGERKAFRSSSGQNGDVNFGPTAF